MTMVTDYSIDALFFPEMTGTNEGLQEGRQGEWKEAFSQGHHPIIGIPIPVRQGNQGPLLVADAVSAWAVERMRGRIFLIPLWPFPTHKHIYQSLWSLMQSMDGLVLPAGIQGTDWYALWKEREQDPGPESWTISWEIALAQLATYMGMPILAIGDGAEKWNSALGGNRGNVLRDEVPMTPTTPDTWDRHTIRVRAQSALATALQPAIALQEGEQKPWELAFMPHQGVEQVAPGLRSCAQTEDGAVVAFERRDAAFGLGLVGRLDWGLDQAYGKTLFEAFLHACQSFDQSRQQQQGWEATRDTICATVYDLVSRGQPLLPAPHQSTQEEKRQRSRPLSTPLPAARGSGGQERVRLRSQQPTREELNKIRRQRIKGASR
jgi:gamma-glutamyl-gamma-aminobutyrate hydrolase PuuD